LLLYGSRSARCRGFSTPGAELARKCRVITKQKGTVYPADIGHARFKGLVKQPVYCGFRHILSRAPL
jgi:hypothetical protein